MGRAHFLLATRTVRHSLTSHQGGEAAALGWATPYSSITLKLALPIPLNASRALPEIVTDTACPRFGAVDGFADAVEYGS
jgi:hypothetical protein